MQACVLQTVARLLVDVYVAMTLQTHDTSSTATAKYAVQFWNQTSAQFWMLALYSAASECQLFAFCSFGVHLVG